MNQKYTKQILEEVVIPSRSINDVMRRLGLKTGGGGGHSYITKQIRYFEIDTSHFYGRSHNLGKLAANRKPWNQILVKRTGGDYEKAFVLRRALIESGREYKCEICQLFPIWENKELRLQVDHINRNRHDNRMKNLRFLCPNCHTQTPGHSGSKNQTDVTVRNNYQKIKNLQT